MATIPTSSLHAGMSLRSRRPVLRADLRKLPWLTRDCRLGTVR